MNEPKYSYNHEGVFVGLGNKKLTPKECADRLNAQADKISELESRQSAQLLELVDGAYTLVELYKPDPKESPYNVKWRKNWLEKARALGASSY